MLADVFAIVLIANADDFGKALVCRFGLTYCILKAQL